MSRDAKGLLLYMGTGAIIGAAFYVVLSALGFAPGVG
jgi:hypothetical protein